MQALSSYIIIPIGSVFTVDRVSKSLQANDDGLPVASFPPPTYLPLIVTLPLVGKFTLKFNYGRNEIQSIFNTIQGVRHCFFLVNDEESTSFDENLTPEI